jgi:nitroreductase
MVTDADKRKALADIYAANFVVYRKFSTTASAAYSADDPRELQRERVTSSAQYLADNFHRAPVIMIPCLADKLDRMPTMRAAAMWGSLLPGVWSFMLAARERALGTAWTTIHLLDDGEERAAELLGIPFDTVTQAGMFPIAYTVGTDFKPARRLPLDTVLHWDQW